MNQRCVSLVRSALLVLAFSAGCFDLHVVHVSAQDERPEPTLQSLQEQLTQQTDRIAELEAQLSSTNEPTTRQQVQSYEDRIVELERNAELLTELETDFVDTASTTSNFTTTGRLHLDYWAFPRDSSAINLIEGTNPQRSPQDRFELRRIRIGIRGTVPPQNVSYQLDLEFSGVDQVEVRDAWIGINDIPLLETVRVGNQKRPYALDQLNSSNFMVFIERPLMIEAVNDPNRRLGIQSFGVAKDKSWNWRYGVFHLENIADNGVISDDTYQLELAGRLAATPWFKESECRSDYWHVGFATSFAFPSEDQNNTTARFRTRPEARSVSRWFDTEAIVGTQAYQLLFAESVLNLGPVQLGGEYVSTWVQRSTATGPTVHFQGGYIYASYFLTGESLPWNRELGILGRLEPKRDFLHAGSGRFGGRGAWQLAGRLSHADFNDDNINGGRGRSATLALNWYWNSHTRLQFNYIFGRIDDRDVGGNLVSGSYQIAGTRLMIDY